MVWKGKNNNKKSGMIQYQWQMCTQGTHRCSFLAGSHRQAIHGLWPRSTLHGDSLSDSPPHSYPVQVLAGTSKKPKGTSHGVLCHSKGRKHQYGMKSRQCPRPPQHGSSQCAILGMEKLPDSSSATCTQEGSTLNGLLESPLTSNCSQFMAMSGPYWHSTTSGPPLHQLL